jgi:hypothetical protein
MENGYEIWNMDISGLEEGPMVGPCEQSNEPSGSIKGREFLD